MPIFFLFFFLSLREVLQISFFISLYRFFNKKLFIFMIQCSPQELIAQSLYNCYYQNQPKTATTSFKSAPKNTRGKTPVRAAQKISLKKSPSLSKGMTQQHIINTKTSLPQKTPTVSPYFMHIMPNRIHSVRLIENKSNINVRFVEKQETITYLTPFMAYQHHYRSHNEYLLNPQNINQGVRVEVSKMSRADTYYSSNGTENYQNSNIYGKNPDDYKTSRPIKKQKESYAEKNSLTSSQAPLQKLNPKIAESVVDENSREEDQYSQVIKQYFPSKFKVSQQYSQSSASMY